MFGHSLGGDTAAEVMGRDRRLRAGVNLDGSINGPVATAGIGTIAAGRAVAAERAYLGAFFDLHLRHRDGRLLDAPSTRFPEIEFVP